MKQEIIEALANLNLDIEGLDGNEDALTKAMEHIDQAIDLLVKYAVEE